MSGGDNLLALKDATAVEQTGALLRDAVIESIEALTAKKKKITSAITKRVKIEE